MMALIALSLLWCCWKCLKPSTNKTLQPFEEEEKPNFHELVLDGSAEQDWEHIMPVAVRVDNRPKKTVQCVVMISMPRGEEYHFGVQRSELPHSESLLHAKGRTTSIPET